MALRVQYDYSLRNVVLSSCNTSNWNRRLDEYLSLLVLTCFSYHNACSLSNFLFSKNRRV
jgi:hypothetical protein